MKETGSAASRERHETEREVRGGREDGVFYNGEGFNGKLRHEDRHWEQSKQSRQVRWEGNLNQLLK